LRLCSGVLGRRCERGSSLAAVVDEKARPDPGDAPRFDTVSSFSAALGFCLVTVPAQAAEPGGCQAGVDLSPQRAEVQPLLAVIEPEEIRATRRHDHWFARAHRSR